MESLCVKCKGKGLCGKPCKILKQFSSSIPKITTHFSGPSPPEIFVGRIGYPYVNTGILAPTNYESKHSDFNNAEQWSKSNLNIANILRLRSQLIYGKTQTNIKSSEKIKDIIKELAMSDKPTSTEFFLKRKPIVNLNISNLFKPMINPAPIEKVNLEENVKIQKKVDYLVNDVDCKATTAIDELYKSNIGVDHLQKILSVGLIGKKVARRMVPTRWSITAIDDIISKELINKIKNYDSINEIELFSDNYLGNFIEILLLPGMFCFDAIEAWDSTDSFENKIVFSEDYESFDGRKKYASNITGGYYAMRLPVSELLERIRRQASVFVFRRITHEYYAPLGVGIVRETTRRAIENKSEKFNSINEALVVISKRTGISIEEISQRSWLLKNYGKQKTINDFL